MRTHFFIPIFFTLHRIAKDEIEAAKHEQQDIRERLSQIEGEIRENQKQERCLQTRCMKLREDINKKHYVSNEGHDRV